MNRRDHVMDARLKDSTSMSSTQGKCGAPPRQFSSSKDVIARGVVVHLDLEGKRYSQYLKIVLTNYKA